MSRQLQFNFDVQRPKRRKPRRRAPDPEGSFCYAWPGGRYQPDPEPPPQRRQRRRYPNLF